MNKKDKHRINTSEIIDLKKNRIKTLYNNDLLLKKIRGKNIIHLGFVDHLELLEKKIKENQWLHKLLCEASFECYGIDINKKGVDFIKDRFQDMKVFCLDITREELPDEILNRRFDYILLPDVLEHIGDPVYFLENLRRRFAGIADKMIITVPNAFRIRNFVNALFYREIVNSDHRFWFTPHTISKVLEDSGFVVDRISFTERALISRRYFFKRIFLKKYQFFRDTLYCEVFFRK